jgi:hypothetical protein
MADGFNPQPVNPSNNTGQNVTDPGGGQTVNEGIGSAIQGVEDIVATIMSNPPILIGIVLLVAVAYILFKKMDERATDDAGYEGKDWEKIIPSDIKYMIQHAGLDTDKELTRGDFTSLGTVYKYDTFQMPKDMEYEDLLFNMEDDEEIDLSEEDFKEVYVFMVAPSDGFGNMMWKATDLYFDMDLNTTLYIVDKDSVEEEHGRFKMKEEIDFKREYGNILVEKGIATENVTDQFPLYQARKNIIEGLEEFTMKTLFLDRQHSTAIAQMREDVDEEALKKFLNQGENF